MITILYRHIDKTYKGKIFNVFYCQNIRRKNMVHFLSISMQVFDVLNPLSNSKQITNPIKTTLVFMTTLKQ